jgi:hypothetical protein
VIVTRYKPAGVFAGTLNVAPALPPAIVQVPETAIGDETVTVHPLSAPLNPKPVTATDTVPLAAGVIKFGLTVTCAVGVPTVKVVDAEFPFPSFAVTTYVPAGMPPATVNVPEIWPFPLGPGTRTLQPDDAKSPLGVEPNVHPPETAFELNPAPVTETTAPVTPFPGVTEIPGTTVN